MTIKNAAQLQQTREQVARLRRGIEAIRLQVEAKNKTNFDILVEGPRDMIKEMEEDIDEYLASLQLPLDFDRSSVK